MVDIEGEEGGRGFNVRVEYQDPKPGQMVAQVITYPFVVVKTGLKEISGDTVFKFLIGGDQRLVRTAEYLE